jgi:hypothetical protein
MTSKASLIDDAFAELSLSDAAGFEVDPDEKQYALRRLDRMLATWARLGINVGYNFSGDINSQSGVPDTAEETIACNLARRLAPRYGKQLRPETLQIAREGYDALFWDSAQPIEQQLPHTMARGAGNKPWRTINRVFMPQPDPSQLGNTDGGDLDFEG